VAQGARRRIDHGHSRTSKEGTVSEGPEQPEQTATAEAEPDVPGGAAPGTQASSEWGRVAEDGSVYVRIADGELQIGSWAAGTSEEGLAFYQRKFEGLKAEVELLEKRLNTTNLDAKDYREITTETLVLLGDRTQPYLARAAHFLDETMPNAHLLTLPGLDHQGPEDHPSRIAAPLLAFFRGSGLSN